MPNMKRAFCALVSLLLASLAAEATTLTDTHPAIEPAVSIVKSANLKSVNPSDQTNDYYVTDYASIDAAVSAIGSSVATLVIPSTTTVANNLTIPSTLTIKQTGSGLLDINSGVTLTIQGPVQANAGRRFFSGAGKVSFSGNKSLPEIPVKWFGVVCDGTTDDRAAFQAVIDASFDSQKITKPDKCTMRIGSTINVYGKRGLTIQLSAVEDGYNHETRDIEYVGSSNTRVFHFVNSGSNVLAGGRIYSTVAGLIFVDIDQSTDQTTYGQGSSTSNIIRGMTFDHTASDSGVVGVRIAYTQNNNNERMQIKNSACLYSPASGSNNASNTSRGTCIKLGDATAATGYNVLNTYLEHVYWFGVTYGVDFANGGELTSLSGQSNFSTIDYKLTAFSQSSTTIIGHRSEGQRQFLTSGSTGSVNLIGNEIGTGGWNSSYPIIKMNLGHLSMTNNVFVGIAASGIQSISGCSQCSLTSNGNGYLGDSGTVNNLASFGYGAHSINDYGQGLTHYPSYYPGESGGQTEIPIYRAWSYGTTSFKDALSVGTGSGGSNFLKLGGGFSRLQFPVEIDPNVGISMGYGAPASNTAAFYGSLRWGQGAGVDYICARNTGTGWMECEGTQGSPYVGWRFKSMPVEVQGTIKSTSGGFIFPDGTTQTTAATNATTPFAARVYHSSDTSISNATSTILAFNSESSDNQNVHSTSSNNSRLVCPSAGFVMVGANVDFDANATGYRIVNIKLNGTTYLGGSAIAATPGGNQTRISVSTAYQCSANDYFELEVYQTSGGALDVKRFSDYSPIFWIVKTSN